MSVMTMKRQITVTNILLIITMLAVEHGFVTEAFHMTNNVPVAKSTPPSQQHYPILSLDSISIAAGQSLRDDDNSKQQQQQQQPMIFLFRRATMLSIMAATILTFSSLVPTAAEAATTTTTTTSIGWDGTTLQPCPTNSNCVSSSTKEPPNRYLSPLRIVKDRPIAFENAVKSIEKVSSSSSSSLPYYYTIVDIDPSKYYIHLQVPGTARNSLDDIELYFTDADTVNIRCHAQVTLPYAPFCVKKNCINGAQDQRDRLEALALKILGLPFADAYQMKSSAKWTPIFFNADRVPDMMDDDADFY